MSQEVVKRPDEVVRQYGAEFGLVLPSHINPEQFTRLAMGALRRNPKLEAVAERNIGSLLQALLEAARLGLEPGSEEFSLVPMGKEIQGIVGYKGQIELMYRTGMVSAVHAEVVRQNDTFSFQPGDATPTHTIDWFGARGQVLGAYAYARMVDGSTSKVVVIGPDEIARARSAARGSASESSPWNTDYAAMVLKTAVHRLATWVPTSAEIRGDGSSQVLRHSRSQEVLPTVTIGERMEPSGPPTVSAAHLTPKPTPAPEPESVEVVDPTTGEIVDAEILEPGDE